MSDSVNNETKQEEPTQNEPKQEAAGITFRDLNLSEPLLKTLDDLGYTKPSPIQEKIIPLVLLGRDVIGQAQTGTGKTAAFALPILDKINAKVKQPQVLVLAPTRELAMQVAEAFKTYAKLIRGIKILAVYGGQDFKPQLQALRDGAQIVVGTPGRMMDHMRRGTLKLDEIKHIVLDEADEMLRMGFIDDIEWIMDQLPEERQTALLSATMPAPIRRIAQKHLIEPEEIKIKVKTTTAETIRQRYYFCHRSEKFDALARILEAETLDAMIIFVRTKNNTVELSEKLQRIGYSCAALNGDIAQNQREQTVKRIKNGAIDIIIATDVAARGLDVERITHVINYDVPFDAESYVHRIGRTGRAGRSGDAILFVEPREKQFLRVIERTTNKSIEEMSLPKAEDVTKKRIANFKEKITATIKETKVEELDFYLEIMSEFLEESESELEPIVAALAKLAQGGRSLVVKDQPRKKPRERSKERNERGRDRGDRNNRRERGPRDRKPRNNDNIKRNSYRIEVGSTHGAAAKHILGAVCNEAELDSKYVGTIDINDTYTVIDLPSDMPKETFSKLANTFIMGQKTQIKEVKNHKKSSSPQGKKRAPSSRDGGARKPRRKDA